jgi:hypothetical protein
MDQPQQLQIFFFSASSLFLLYFQMIIMKSFLILLSITIVHSQANDLFSNLALSGSSNGHSLDQCVEISNARPCASMPWNMTIFPNLLGHTRAEGTHRCTPNTHDKHHRSLF